MGLGSRKTKKPIKLYKPKSKTGYDYNTYSNNETTQKIIYQSGAGVAYVVPQGKKFLIRYISIGAGVTSMVCQLTDASGANSYIASAAPNTVHNIPFESPIIMSEGEYLTGAINGTFTVIGNETDA